MARITSAVCDRCGKPQSFDADELHLPEGWDLIEMGSGDWDVCASCAVLFEMLMRMPGPGIDRVLLERSSQLNEHEYTVEHDREFHPFGELTKAAIAYALPAPTAMPDGQDARKTFWPWEDHPLKPGRRPEELAKAGALLIAEIDRIGENYA